MEKELKYYLIGFIGCSDFRKVLAHSVKEAKKAFASNQGIQVSDSIVSYKWTTENWNRSLHDDRPSISWTVIP